MTELAVNLKDLITLRCANDKNSSLVISGYKGFISMAIFSDKKVVFKQTLNRYFALVFKIGLKKVLAANPDTNVGTMVIHDWKPGENGQRGEQIPKHYIKLSKNGNGIIILAIKTVSKDAEYQFNLSPSNAYIADWVGTDAEKSKVCTQNLVELLEQFAVYDALARLDKPERAPSGFAQLASSNNDSVPF
jgi:hypothetical protein